MHDLYPPDRPYFYILTGDYYPDWHYGHGKLGYFRHGIIGHGHHGKGKEFFRYKKILGHGHFGKERKLFGHKKFFGLGKLGHKKLGHGHFGHGKFSGHKYGGGYASYHGKYEKYGSVKWGPKKYHSKYYRRFGKQRHGHGHGHDENEIEIDNLKK